MSRPDTSYLQDCGFKLTFSGRADKQELVRAVLRLDDGSILQISVVKDNEPPKRAKDVAFNVYSVLARTSSSVTSEWRVSSLSKDNIDATIEQFRTIVNVKKVLMSEIEKLEDAYLEAANELRSAQAGLLNTCNEIDQFVRTRDALKTHADFSGFLPETYFSGGDLDPVGVQPKGLEESQKQS